MSTQTLLVLLLATPLLGSILVLLVGLLSRKVAAGCALLLAAATTGWGTMLAIEVASHGSVGLRLPWNRFFRAGLTLQADALSLTVALLMALIVTMSIIYAMGYYGKRPPSGVFYALITIFLGGMIGTALAGETILFYVFWETMLIPSCALLVFWGEGRYALRSGFKYFIFTHIGAVALLAAFLWIFALKGTTDFAAIGPAIATLPSSILTVMAALLFFGFGVKMAIFPFHSWLPGSYDDAPAPVTAIISGAMISAGIYGMIRFPLGMFPIKALLPLQVPLLLFAVVTQFYGAIMAITTKRLRRILAYSSISQMGYVLFGIGSLTGLGAAGSALHLVTHGLTKSMLFMVVGSVLLQTSREKTSELGGLAPNMPVSAWGCIVGALSLAGIPPLAGFQSEWMIFAGGFASQRTWLAIFSMVAGVFSAGYALLLIQRIFFGVQSPGLEETQESSRWMLVPVLVLSVLIIGIGIVPGPLAGWLDTVLKNNGLIM